MKKLLLLLTTIPFLSFAQTDIYTIYGLGIQSFYQTSYDDAVLHFDQCIEMQDDFMLGYYYRGLSYAKTNQFEAAIKDFSSALLIDSTYKDALVNRAETYLKYKKYAQSAADFESLVSSNPNYHLFYRALGLSYYYMRQYEISDLAYAKYLSVATDDFETHFQRGMANLYGNNFNQAIQDFTTVLNLNPTYYSALDMRGLSFQKNNMILKACEDWDLAVKSGYSIAIDNVKKYCITTVE